MSDNQKLRHAFMHKFRSNSDKNGAEIEDVIERDDLLTKIKDAATDGPVSLWTLFEELATPLDIAQGAVVYALEELFGRGDIELASREYLTEFVTADSNMAPVGSPAWFRRLRREAN